MSVTRQAVLVVESVTPDRPLTGVTSSRNGDSKDSAKGQRVHHGLPGAPAGRRPICGPRPSVRSGRLWASPDGVRELPDRRTSHLLPSLFRPHAASAFRGLVKACDWHEPALQGTLRGEAALLEASAGNRRCSSHWRGARKRDWPTLRRAGC